MGLFTGGGASAPSSSGGGGATVLYDKLTSAFDYSNNASYQDVLSVDVEANGIYEVYLFIGLVTTTSTPEFDLQRPSGSTYLGRHDLVRGGTSFQTQVSGSQQTSFFSGHASFRQTIHGLLEVGSTAGQFKFRIRQTTAATGSNTVAAETWMRLIKVA